MGIKTFRERSPVVIGIISILGIAIGTTLAFFINELPFVKRAYEIEAEFANASGLTKDNQVRVAGVKVGMIESVELDGDRVHVVMTIDQDTDIPQGARADIKLATLLGTKFIQIDGTGGPPYMEEGDLIPLEDTTVPFEIYQVSNRGTNVLEGLDGDLLNDLLVELTDLTSEAKEEVGVALEGLNELGTGLNARQDDLRSLLVGAEDLTDLLADEGDELVRLIDGSNTVLASLAGQREELQSLLETTKFMAAELEDLVVDNRENLDGIFTKLHNALVVLERNVEHVDVALKYAGDSSRYFGSIFQQGRWGDIFPCSIMVTSACEG